MTSNCQLSSVCLCGLILEICCIIQVSAASGKGQRYMRPWWAVDAHRALSPCAVFYSLNRIWNNELPKNIVSHLIYIIQAPREGQTERENNFWYQVSLHKYIPHLHLLPYCLLNSGIALQIFVVTALFSRNDIWVTSWWQHYRHCCCHKCLPTTFCSVSQRFRRDLLWWNST